MKLKQKTSFQGSHIYEIIDDNIKVERRHYLEKTEFQIPIRILNKDAIYHKNINIPYIAAVSIFGLLALTLAVILAISEYPREAKEVQAFFLVITSAIAIISAIKLRASRVNNLIYTSMVTGEAVLVLSCNKPDSSSFQNFTTELNAKIQQYYKERSSSALAGNSLADELMKFKKLLQDGDITELEFSAAKAKLLETDGEEWKYG